MNDIDISYLFELPPEKAVQYLESKGFTFSFRWQDVAAQAHAKAFTVAGAMKLDILTTIRAQVEKALREGSSLQEFKKNLTPELQKLGWWGKEVEVANPETGEVRKTRVDGYRLRTIYQTNIQSAYMAGRYQSQIQDDYRPYWEYVAVMDSNTRPHHAELNGTVLQSDDPFWDTNYPINGWNCRCRVRARSAEQVERLGLKVVDGSTLPTIADQAFTSNPGKNATPLDVVAWQKAEKVAESARNAWIADMIRPEDRQRILDAFVDDLASKMQSTGRVRTVGYVDSSIFSALQQENSLISPIVVLSEKQLLHSIRDGKNKPDDIKRLISFLSAPKHVFMKGEELLFVQNLEDETPFKMVFKVQKRDKNLHAAVINFITAGYFDAGMIANKGYKKIR